jgi:polar amino acid transport system substrate-binding protein
MRVFPGQRRRPWIGVAVLSLAIAGVSLAESAQTHRLKLVSTVWPPFTNAPGQARFALDLVEAGLGRIAVSATTEFVDAAQYTTSLMTGPFDGSGAAWRDAEREKALIYSQPYLENRLVLVGRKGAVVSSAKLAELRGKRIAVVEGYSYGEIENAGPVFVRSKSEEDSLRLLLDSKVDYTLMDELVVQYIVNNYATEARTKLQFGSTPLIRRHAQLRNMIVDRTYHKLLHVDWIRADVDGDGQLEYIPKTDQAGKAPPQQAYALVADEKVKLATGPQRFYIGKGIYNSWSDVPDSYKVSAPGIASPDKSTLTWFKFTWK